MKSDFIFALYVFCANYHSGQNSRGYRILSRLESRYRPRLSDHAWNEISSPAIEQDHEWASANAYYHELVNQYAERV